MSKIKSLADQLRKRMAEPKTPAPEQSTASKEKKGRTPKTEKKASEPEIISAVRHYDYNSGKNTIHVRLDEGSITLLSHLKMATGIDQVKLVAFAVREFFAKHPEVKAHLKNYLQNLDL